MWPPPPWPPPPWPPPPRTWIVKSSVVDCADGAIPGLIGDIAAARSIGTADSANTAAAARHRLRTKPGVEIEILVMSPPRILQATASPQAKLPASCPSAGCPTLDASDREVNAA